MRGKLGSSFVSVVLAIAGVSAIGVGGFSAMTGKTLCSMMSCDTAKSSCTADAKVVAAKNTAKKDGSCCPLGETAKVVAAADKSGECAKACSDAKVVAASNKAGECAKSCSDAKVVAAADKAGECAKTCSGAAVVAAADKAGQCSKPCLEGARTQLVAAEAELKKAEATGCCESKETAQAKVIAARYIVAEAEFEQAKNGCCKTKAVAEAKLIEAKLVAAECAAKCAAKSNCEKTIAEAKVRVLSARLEHAEHEFAKASAAGCCEAKSAAEAKVIAARAAAKEAGIGCCKGTGVRADGTACCGKCDGAKVEGASNKEAGACSKPCTDNKAEAKEVGEPVASR